MRSDVHAPIWAAFAVLPVFDLNSGPFAWAGLLLVVASLWAWMEISRPVILPQRVGNGAFQRYTRHPRRQFSIMRKIISVFAFLALASALFAADPFVGTWKLDPARTKYTEGTAPKDVTLVIEDQGENYQVTATGTYVDGSPISVKYTVPIKGGTGQAQEGPYDSIMSKRVSATVRENSYMKNGKEVSSRHIVVSKNGKTLRSTVKGTDSQGKAVAGVDVFEKQ